MTIYWSKGLKIYLFYGQKGSGKSYFMTRLFFELLKEYKKIERKYPNLPKRKFYSSQKFAKQVEDAELGNHLAYWTHPDQLYSLRDSDIGWDEISKDLPAGSWKDTPKELRQVFSHLRKRGNRIFANTQIYEDIDISFRRQIDKAFRIEKIIGSEDITATRPRPRFVWGVIMFQEFDPMFLEHERDESKRLGDPERSGVPHITLIRKRFVEAYDTQMELPPYRPNKLRELVLECVEGENCRDKRHRFHVKHIPV